MRSLARLALSLVSFLCLSACVGDPVAVMTPDAGTDSGVDLWVAVDAAPLSIDAGPPAVDAWRAPPPHDPCRDGYAGYGESDVDCGGESCGRCALGQLCWRTSDCEDTAVCVHRPGLSPSSDEPRGTCRRRVSECDADSCAPGEACVHEDWWECALYCVARAGRGEPCELPLDKDVSTCAEGLTCIDYRCVPRTTPEGEGCSSQTCLEGLVCSIADHTVAARLTCFVPHALGEGCYYPEDCAEGLTCDLFDEVCVPRRRRGETCRAGTWACATGSHCRFPEHLYCRHDGECGRESHCCATETGAECRPDGEACEPPLGVCGERGD